MGVCYQYDGTFSGLLTLLDQLLPQQQEPTAIGMVPPPQLSLFDEVRIIATDDERAARCWAALTDRLPAAGLHQVTQVFLADRPERELIIWRYCQLGWRVGTRITGMLAHPHVAPVWQLAQEVGREAHRYLGFVRFQEVTGGYYYAAISPDHRILPLVASHFAARFSDQHWMIHDVKHGEGLVFDRQRGQWLLLPMETHGTPDLTPTEEQFQTLWREYFSTLAITARANPSLQQSKVPLKVRPWLVEFGG